MAGGREFQILEGNLEKVLSAKLWSVDLGTTRWPAVVVRNEVCLGSGEGQRRRDGGR